TIMTHVMVDKLEMDGAKATGVIFKRKGKTQTVKAKREVVLCAGSIGSPTILQRSGIGPADVLKDAGVAVVKDLPGVGANLQDHLEVYFQFRCTQPITLNSKIGLLSKAWIGARWFFTKTGLGATNHFEACAFIRSKAGVKYPDIQYHFLPAAMRYDGNAAFDGHGFQVHVGPNKPHSRGAVKIRSSDPEEHPEILFNYLEDQRDVDDWRRVVRLTREIIGQDAMDEFRGPEIEPGENMQTDEEIDKWVRGAVESAYHASCTCKMGAEDDPMSVITPDLKVKGIENLRVVDSSIFPTVPNGNLNSPSMMVGEKGADIIRGRTPLAASNAPSWFDPNWETQQRETPLS
ncbi:MAG: GMC oxidoreductase, partial [Alphaproteobacteria bacterium]